jgi:hypothetical protein
MGKVELRKEMFRTSDNESFDFLVERGHLNYQVKLERGAYIANFADSPGLQADVAEFRKRSGRTIRTVPDLFRALTP